MRASSHIMLIIVLLVGIPFTVGSAMAVPGVDEDVDCDDETEIDVARSGDEVVRTKNVSKAWYQNAEYVQEVREDFAEEYPLEEIEWLTSIGITSIDKPVCDMNQMAISLGVTDEEAASEELGDTYKEVPLVIEERGEAVPLVGSADDANAADGAASDGGSGDGPKNDASEGETVDVYGPGFGFTAALGALVIAVSIGWCRKG